MSSDVKPEITDQERAKAELALGRLMLADLERQRQEALEEKRRQESELRHVSNEQNISTQEEDPLQWVKIDDLSPWRLHINGKPDERLISNAYYDCYGPGIFFEGKIRKRILQNNQVVLWVDGEYYQHAGFRTGVTTTGLFKLQFTESNMVDSVSLNTLRSFVCVQGTVNVRTVGSSGVDIGTIMSLPTWRLKTDLTRVPREGPSYLFYQRYESDYEVPRGFRPFDTLSEIPYLYKNKIHEIDDKFLETLLERVIMLSDSVFQECLKDMDQIEYGPGHHNEPLYLLSSLYFVDAMKDLCPVTESMETDKCFLQ